MFISDSVFNRMKSLGITNGVFLFVSNDKSSLSNYSLQFAQNLLGYRSEDVALNQRVYLPEGDFITADIVNDFIAFESKKSVGVPSKILIMHDIDLLKDNVSDKMLKCIEDYNDDSLIILTTTSLEKVSRTIKSRCMVFKEWVDSDDYYVTNKDQFLGFIERMADLSYSDIGQLVTEVQDNGLMPVIQALFVNCFDSESLSIAMNALDAHLTGSSDEQVSVYLVNSFWCLKHNLRSWDNS